LTDIFALSGLGKSQDEDDFDPVEEFLAVLPPPLARGLVAVGKKLNPSGMQLVAVKKDLHEDPNKANDTVYTSGNKHRQLVLALTAGLKPYGLALAIATVVWLLTTLITPTYDPSPLLFSGPAAKRPTGLTTAFGRPARVVSCRVVRWCVCRAVVRVSCRVRRFFGYPYLYTGFSISDLFSASWALLLWGGNAHP
jgi:hypothetical protein